VTAVNGVATFTNLSIDRAANGYVLSATGGSLTGASSGPFNISIGPAAQLAFTTQPNNVAAGNSIVPAIQVTVQDAGGNAVTTSTASITMGLGSNPGSGVLNGGLPVSAVAVNGVATFSNLSIDRTGTGYTLTASSAGLTGATSSNFNVTAPAVTVAVTTPSTAIAGTPFSVTVTAQDAFGSTATGYTGTIQFTASDSLGTLPGTYTFVTSDNGVHTFMNQVMLTKAGPQTVSATDTNRSSITGTSGPIAVSADTARTLLVTGYPNTTAGLMKSFMVTARDSFGNTATGYTGTVHFTSSDNQATLPTDYTFVSSDGGVA
jgi:hypothetical protein